jgi:flagella basal body P-ring formation protein FlgA
MPVAPLLIFHAALASVTPAVDVANPEELLLSGLKERYPTVTDWEIRPLNGEAPTAAGTARIVRLGSRSAIRVGDRVIWYAVSGSQFVLRATTSHQAGAALTPADGESAWADVLSVSCEPLLDASRLQGMRTRRGIRASQIICTDAVEPKPPVARGDDVTVRYVGPRLSLSTRGVAEADGSIGDAVEVKRPGAGDVFRAVVSGTREVTIHE